jgi:hypothetical protein
MDDDSEDDRKCFVWKDVENYKGSRVVSESQGAVICDKNCGCFSVVLQERSEKCCY